MTLDIDGLRARLLGRRDEIVKLADDSADSRKAVELDQSSVGRLSRMDALQVQAMAVDAGRRRQAELARIEAALKRIEAGDYGDCLGCGEPIAVKRLELDPAVPLCIDCASGSGR